MRGATCQGRCRAWIHRSAAAPAQPRSLQATTRAVDWMEIAAAICPIPQPSNRKIPDAKSIKMSPIRPVQAVTALSACTPSRQRWEGEGPHPTGSACLKKS